MTANQSRPPSATWRRRRESSSPFWRSGRRRNFGWSGLEETLHYSDRACRLWNQILDVAATVPSPITFFDATILMAPIVTLRGKKETVDFYQAVYDELQTWVRDGYAAIPGERFRIYWEDKPFWFGLREMSEYFSERKAAILCSLYTHAWSYRFDTSDPIGTLARNYATVYPNVSFDQRADFIADYMKRYRLHGLIAHGNRSCKGGVFGMAEIIDGVKARGGGPGILVDADMCDRRFFLKEQVYDRIDTFLESLASRYGL